MLYIVVVCKKYPKREHTCVKIELDVRVFFALRAVVVRPASYSATQLANNHGKEAWSTYTCTFWSFTLADGA